MKKIAIFLVLGCLTINVVSQQYSSKKIALTLDDGPSGALTETFLALFEQHDVRVTFFHVGRKSAQQTALCREILERGHEIGNHSWSHQRLTELDAAEVKKEIESFQSFFIDSLDYLPVSFRAPFLKRDDYIDIIIRKHQLITVGADIYARDAKANIEPDVIVGNLNKAIPDGSIILCHEREHTLEALRVLIPIWKEQNYEFVTIQTLESE